jgi:hypothetical protein
MTGGAEKKNALAVALDNLVTVNIESEDNFNFSQ